MHASSRQIVAAEASTVRRLPTAGSLFAGLDQCPQALMHHLRHWGVQGVQRHLQLVDAGQDLPSLNSVMMGIDRSKPFRHLFKADRPVTLTSPLTRSESRAARAMLVPSLELSGTLTPETFAYRADIGPAFLVLALRAVVFACLESHGTAAITDWDSADAFLCQQQEDCTPLYRFLQLPWDFGPWAMKYYGCLRIHPLTADGFAPPYVTEECRNQGDNPSGDTYQVGELVVSGSLLHLDDVRVPPTPSRVPLSNLSYSDDRHLVRPALTSLVNLTRLCTRATVAKDGLVHMNKLRFFALDLDGSALRLQQTQVSHYLTSTSTDSPKVVGIPLSHALRPRGVYADLAKQIARMRRRLDTNPTTTILALRSLWAFILSKLDYVTSGVAVPPEHVAEASVQARALYRQVLGLPCWTSRALMSLAPQLRGSGLSAPAPSLSMPPPPHLHTGYLLPQPPGTAVSPVPIPGFRPRQ